MKQHDHGKNTHKVIGLFVICRSSTLITNFRCWKVIRCSKLWSFRTRLERSHKLFYCLCVVFLFRCRVTSVIINDVPSLLQFSFEMVHKKKEEAICQNCPSWCLLVTNQIWLQLAKRWHYYQINSGQALLRNEATQTIRLCCWCTDVSCIEFFSNSVLVGKQIPWSFVQSPQSFAEAS